MEKAVWRGLGAVIGALLLTVAPAVAQTPDGQTPAEEQVCDVLLAPGVTPGLYGLCVAFCAAHDASEGDFVAACRMADMKVLETYNRKKAPTDPGMPCLRPACPCFDAGDVAGIMSRPYACKWSQPKCVDGQPILIWEAVLQVKDGKDFADVRGDALKPAATVCQLQSSGTGSVQITFEEALSCRAVLLAAAPECFAGDACP